MRKLDAIEFWLVMVIIVVGLAFLGAIAGSLLGSEDDPPEPIPACLFFDASTGQQHPC